MITRIFRERGERRVRAVVLDDRGRVHHKVFLSANNARTWIRETFYHVTIITEEVI